MTDKKEWGFGSLYELHAASNALLRQATLNERYKRWRKVVEMYNELLWMISLDQLPAEYEPPSSYTMLLYELHFHLGVAYQHLNDHKNAIKQFSKTIEVVSIAKNGCLAGCLTNSCLMTPIYARRAFAHANLGSYRLALKDAEKAVVLDSKSPDVYCIRALVHSTFDEELVGIKDLDRALEIKKDHVCATMLKASFTKPLRQCRLEARLQKVQVQISRRFSKAASDQAVRLCGEAETYLTCNSFSHSCVIEFYDKVIMYVLYTDGDAYALYIRVKGRFLFPLSVPHTITVINLTPEKPSKKQLESSYMQKPPENQSRPLSAVSQNQGVSTEVFRCGTPKNNGGNRVSWKRRMDYSNAVRKHVSRPKSASEFFAQLERRQRQEVVRKRAQSSIVRPGERFARPQSTAEASDVARPFTAPVLRTETSSATPPRPHVSAMSNTHDFTDARSRNDNSRESLVKPAKTKKFEIATPSDYSMPVFQTMNIKFAPRMYYRPWIGDKLPVTERTKVLFSPKFY